VVEASLEEGVAPAVATEGLVDTEEADPACAVGVNKGNDAAFGFVGIVFGRYQQPAFFAGGEVVGSAVVGAAVLPGREEPLAGRKFL
jgi:hypothetical protein